MAVARKNLISEKAYTAASVRFAKTKNTKNVAPRIYLALPRNVYRGTFSK